MMRDATLSTAQWRYLAQAFRLKPDDAADSRSILAADLLDPLRCREVLQQIMPAIGAPDLAISASLWVKRLAFLIGGNSLYAMTVFDRALPLNLHNTWLEYAHDNGLWSAALPVAHLQLSQYAPGERERWRAEQVRLLFAGLFAPLVRILAETSGIPRQILWENIAVRVFSLYEGRMDDLEPAAEQRRLADFRWLLEDAPPELFGESYNPLQRFRRPPHRLKDGSGYRRFRRTCCFYYKASQPVEYCQNCPLLRR